MSKWLPGFWFSCAQYARRLSEAEGRPLTHAERIASAFHHLWCTDCRRYRTQVVQLDTTLEQFCRAFADGKVAVNDSEPLVLPDDFKKQLIEQLGKKQ